MLENLLQLVKEHAQEQIVQNPEIPNEYNDQAIEATANTVAQSLQGSLASGNLTDVISLLSGKTAPQNCPVGANMMQSLSSTLGKQFGVSSSAATSIAATLIPMVLKSLVGRTNDPANSQFTMEGIFNSLTGGKSSGVNFSQLLGALEQGPAAGGQAGSPLGDIAKMLAGGAQSNPINATGVLGKIVGSLLR